MAVLLARQRDNGDRGCPRFHANLEATLRLGNQARSCGKITNVSRSGGFMRPRRCPPLGTDRDPRRDAAGHHITTRSTPTSSTGARRGVGLQFSGASDVFRAHLDEYLAGLVALTIKRQLRIAVQSWFPDVCRPG